MKTARATAIVGFLALAIPSVASAGPRDPATSVPSAPQAVHPAPIQPKTFWHDDRKGGLSHKVSDRKLDEALGGGAPRLSRSYPNVWWNSLRKEDLPGGVGTVVGDWHYTNFGNVEVSPGHTIYGYADFANVGRGPVAADALRGFMDMRIERGYSPETVSGAIDAYVSAVEKVRKDPTWKPTPPAAVAAPNWKKDGEDKLARLTKGGKFDFGDKKLGLLTPPSKVAQSVRALAKKGGPLAEFDIRDVAQYVRSDGSTAGFARYWALAKRDGKSTILEFDEAIVPAPAALHEQAPLEARLEASQKGMWGVVAKDNYSAVTLNDKEFIVRDWLKMNVPNISEHDLPDVVKFQAEQMGAIHAEGWKNETPAFIKGWLQTNSKVLANQWTRVAEQAKHDSK